MSEKKQVNDENFDTNQYFKYVYGVTDKEIKDLKKFAEDLREQITKFLSVKNKDSLKKIIELFNVFPAYGGYEIFENIYFSDQLILEDFSKEILDYYYNNKKTEAGTDFIKDLNEIISSFYYFCPEAILRKILIKDEESVFNYLIDECKNRSGIFCVMSCRYADLYLASKKTNEKYVLRVVEFFKLLEKRITEANDIIPEVKDAMAISLKDIKKLAFQFKEESKKNSLDQLKIILTRKIDFGNLLHFIIVGNESAVESILASDSFPADIIIKCLEQLKLQQVIEIAMFLNNLNLPDKYDLVQKFIEDNYKIKPEEYILKTRDLVTKYESSKFGILIRNPAMMPMEYDAKTPADAIKEMLSKLSTLANNLTAYISQKSLSISVVLMSKTNLFDTFMKDFETKKHGDLAGGFASKMQDKDVMKKIKESDLVSMNFDQITCKYVICILICLKESIKDDFNLSKKEELFNEAFKVLIKKYKIIMSKATFLRFCEIFFSKIPSKIIPVG